MIESRNGLRLSTKLILANSLLILLVSGTLTVALYWQMRSAQRQAIQERLYDILSFSAPLVDGDFHSLIRLPEDEASPFYRVLSLRLISIQDTSDVIERIYTLRQQEDGRLVYVVDIDANTQAHVGQEYSHPSSLLSTRLVTGPMVEDAIFHDSNGAFISGYTPIYDQFRNVDGILGIDINAESIIANETRARQIALKIFLLEAPFSLLLGSWFARKLTAPVQDLMAGARRVELGQYDQAVPARSRDELGVLANAFNRMSRQLQDTVQGLELEITKHEQAEKQQDTTYKISEATISAKSLDELYFSIHSILDELISVENFYIALYDSATEAVFFPYYSNQHDRQPKPESLELELTEYVRQTGESLLVSSDDFNFFVQQGIVSESDAKPIEWLGIPLKLDENTIGVMATRNYLLDPPFNQDTLELLEFVSTQVAQAIERKRAEEALSQSNERYYRLFEDSPVALWEEDFSAVKQIMDALLQEEVTDIRSFLVSHPDIVAECAKQVKVLDVNKATTILFGAKRKEELLGDITISFVDESFSSFLDELVYVAEGRSKFHREGINQTLGGKRIETSINWSVVPGYEHNFSKVIVSMIDVTTRREFEKNLTYMSTHDALTGLYNRSYFEQEWARIESEALFPASIVMVDVDDLKSTNDTNGHAVGDKMLKDAARILLASFRSIDIVARIGGDEFAVLLPKTNEAEAKKAIQRIKENIQKANQNNSEPLLSLSLGTSVAKHSGSLDKSFRDADAAMYLDKKRKKN